MGGAAEHFRYRRSVRLWVFVLTYAAAAVSAVVAASLMLVLVVAPLRSYRRTKRRAARHANEALSPERRARLEHF
jgi:hypothetical protein